MRLIPSASWILHYGSFGSYGEDFDYGSGTAKFGFFMAADSSRTGRFLDTPEFDPMHDIGNTETIFNRLDYAPGARRFDACEFLSGAQLVPDPEYLRSAGLGPGPAPVNRGPSASRRTGSTRSIRRSVMTWNPFVREDFVNYYPSHNPFADQPATIGENRWLKNFGTRGDFSWVKGKNNFKSGIQMERTALHEDFRFAITQAGYVDPATEPGLVPYDLTEGGHYLTFVGSANIDEYAWYAQDTLTVGNLTLNGGVRVDVYRGLSNANALSRAEASPIMSSRRAPCCASATRTRSRRPITRI